MQSCVYYIVCPRVKGVFKSGVRSFSKHKLSKHKLAKHKLSKHRFSKQSEESINLLARIGAELARHGVEGDAHCGVLVRG
jgi:hypothetical protein